MVCKFGSSWNNSLVGFFTQDNLGIFQIWQGLQELYQTGNVSKWVKKLIVLTRTHIFHNTYDGLIKLVENAYDSCL